jgi:hypothetical protein
MQSSNSLEVPSSTGDIYNPYDLNNDSHENEFISDINTNVADYNLDDIFSLLGIEITTDMDYEKLIEIVNKKCDHQIEIFRALKNPKLVDFFESIRQSVLGKENEETRDNLSEAEQLLISVQGKLDAEKNRGFKTNTTDTTNQKLYESESGAGNPINRKTITKLLNVDSRFRKNYSYTSSTNYKIDLPYPVNNVIELKLSDIEFPATYYPFTNEYENNYFWIRFTQGNGANIYLYIYIPPGNYYHSSFIKHIQDEFDSFGVDIQISFNLSYDNGGGIGVGDGHITIGVNSETNLTSISEIELNFQGKMLPIDLYTTSQKFFAEDNTELLNEYYYTKNLIDYKQRLGWMLGYRKEVYNEAQTHESEGILDIIGPKYLYLILDDYNLSNNVNFFNSSEDTMLENNILARISVKGYAFSIQSQTDLSIYSEPRYFYGPVNINKLAVKLIDEYGRELNLNNMDFSFTLSLITIYSQT